MYDIPNPVWSVVDVGEDESSELNDAWSVVDDGVDIEEEGGFTIIIL